MGTPATRANQHRVEKAWINSMHRKAISIIPHAFRIIHNRSIRGNVRAGAAAAVGGMCKCLCTCHTPWRGPYSASGILFIGKLMECMPPHTLPYHEDIKGMLTHIIIIHKKL